MPERICTVDGCSKPHRAKGLCATHYNRTSYTPEQRHRSKVTTCCICGKPVAKKSSAKYVRTVCSYDCRWFLQSPVLAVPLPETHPAHPRWYDPASRLPAVKVTATLAAREPAPRIFTGGTCARCGAWFMAEDYTGTARYCSIRCGRRVGKHRYRARKRLAYVADVSPAAIFARDGWRCQICKRKVRRDRAVPHPLAPVLDHIVPLAAGAEQGGVHAPHNVQCAHFICNCIKGDRGVVQPLLFG